MKNVKKTDEQSNCVLEPDLMSEPVSRHDCFFKISDVAKKLNLTLRTLRYYEEFGLINPVGHSMGKERFYTKEELSKLVKIKELQDLLGLKLSDIKEILEVESKFDQLKTEFLATESAVEKVSILIQAKETNEDLIRTAEERLSKLKKYKKELQNRQFRIETKLGSMQETN